MQLFGLSIEIFFNLLVYLWYVLCCVILCNQQLNLSEKIFKKYCVALFQLQALKHDPRNEIVSVNMLNMISLYCLSDLDNHVVRVRRLQYDDN